MKVLLNLAFILTGCWGAGLDQEYRKGVHYSTHSNGNVNYLYTISDSAIHNYYFYKSGILHMHSFGGGARHYSESGKLISISTGNNRSTNYKVFSVDNPDYILSRTINSIIISHKDSTIWETVLPLSSGVHIGNLSIEVLKDQILIHCSVDAKDSILYNISFK